MSKSHNRNDSFIISNDNSHEYSTLGFTRTPRMGSGNPLCMGSRPPTVGSQGSRTEHTRALIRAQAGSGADTCPDLVWCDPDLSVYTLASRSGGDPMLPRGILRDISQRAEPNMTPLGYARLRIQYE
jgi:hypothetical protein